MIIGNNEVFKIEANLKQVEYYVFINYCFWIRDIMVGDFSQTSLLNTTIGSLKHILKGEENRKCLQLEKYPGDVLLNYLIKRLGSVELVRPAVDTINVNVPEEQIKNLKLDFSGVENFDGYLFFMIESTGFDRFLCKDLIGDKSIDVKLPKKYFYKCIRLFLQWINESTYLALRSNNT